MDWSGCSVVESVSERLSGVPVLRNTRMPADGILENAQDMSPEEIADSFDLDLHDVLAAIEYAHSRNELPLAS